ncbi:MAG: hypothetical protein P8P30_04220 [Rickettsiales bacterium]|nr:hypothetical protein [Rickettsiales bacterium]
MTEILKICDSAIIEAARGWIDTPFHHQGRVKTVGVDCLGLLIGVASELDLRDIEGRFLADFDDLAYGHMPDEKKLYAGLREALISTEILKPASIALFRIDGTARHLGILGKKNGVFTLIHAYAPARKVIEHRFDQEWAEKLVELFVVVQ